MSEVNEDVCEFIPPDGCFGPSPPLHHRPGLDLTHTLTVETKITFSSGGAGDS